MKNDKEVGDVEQGRIIDEVDTHGELPADLRKWAMNERWPRGEIALAILKLRHKTEGGVK